MKEGKMENCIDIERFLHRNMIVIKSPGTVRHPISNKAITKIEMIVDDAVQLHAQLSETLYGKASREDIINVLDTISVEELADSILKHFQVIPKKVIVPAFNQVEPPTDK